MTLPLLLAGQVSAAGVKIDKEQLEQRFSKLGLEVSDVVPADIDGVVFAEQVTILQK